MRETIEKPYMVRFPKTSIQKQLAKLVSTCNWAFEQTEISPGNLAKKLNNYVRFLLHLNQIDIRKKDGRLYILAYDPEKDSVYWQLLDFEAFRPTIFTIAMQQGFESQVTDEIAFSVFNRMRPRLLPL